MRAFLFDMDGVIVDSEKHWKDIEKEIFSKFFRRDSKLKKDDVTGMSVKDIYKLFKNEVRPGITKEEFARIYDEFAMRIYREKTNIYPGVLEFMKSLKERKITMALVSGSRRSWVDTTLDRFSLRRFFSLVVSIDDYGGSGKPAPEIYLFAAKKLGIKPDDCIVIEDSERGVASAKAAGMFCIGYKNGFNDNHDLSKADLIVKHFNEINIGGL